MRHHRRINALGALTTCALALSLSACAPPIDATWTPPAPSSGGAVRLATNSHPFERPNTIAPPPQEAALPIDDSEQLGLTAGRIRNDALPFQARYLLIPGLPGFNERVRNLLWGAIRDTGKQYEPQAFPVGTGLGERGCVSGSTERAAEELLADPAIGPSGGSGTAVTCSFLGAAGDYLGVRFRMVTGSATANTPASITSDQTETWYVNIRTGDLLDRSNRWNDSAATELWRTVVFELREQLGTLSNVEIADPPPAQIALAEEALNRAVPSTDGAFITLPTGITAPEFEALGAEATLAPSRVFVPLEVLHKWSTPAEQQRLDTSDTAFVGLSATPGATPIDCALVLCAALTYDDGPSELTAELLTTLQQKRALASFFVIGPKASAAPDLVRRMSELGHDIGSHTMTHPELTKLKVPEAVAQVKDAAAIIAGITGKPVTTFRPPFGAVNDSILAATNMPAVLWSVDTNDWRRPGQDALVERSVPVLRPGGIVLFHDTHPDSVAVAGRVIDGLRDRGFTLATVSQLFDGKVPAGRVFAR